MSDHFFKDHLYPLQDEVLFHVATSKSTFYLTGGTLLGRILLNHRYSDDLDFFLNRDPDFSEKVADLLEELKNHFTEIEYAINEDSFVRIYIQKKNIRLKIEFINDVGYRVGQPIKSNSGFFIDTWENVFSNKLTALGRNMAKDYADILFLSLTHAFNWEEMINHSKNKDACLGEIEISEFLMNFELEKLSDVLFLDSINVSRIDKEFFETMAKESLNGLNNSLYGKTLK